MIKRECLPKILHWLDREKILVLKGARQLGKRYSGGNSSTNGFASVC